MVCLGPEQPQTFNIPGYSPGLIVLCPWPISQNIPEPQYTEATAKVLPYELEGRKTTVRAVHTQGLRRIFSDSKNNEGQEDTVTKPAGGGTWPGWRESEHSPASLCHLSPLQFFFSSFPPPTLHVPYPTCSSGHHTTTYEDSGP